MSLDIRPDPDHAQGGFAIFDLHTPLETDSTTITIKNAFSGQFLGADGWQPTSFAFGPYPVSANDAGSRIVVGPEIVNQIEEYTSLDITIGAVQAQTSWPDDVVASPEAAAAGGLATMAGRAAPAAAPVLKAPQTAPEPEPTDTEATQGSENDAENIETVETVRSGTDDGAGNKPLVIGLGVLALIAIAAAVWFFALRDTTPPPEPVATLPAPEPVPAAPEPEPSLCSLEALQSAAAVSFNSVMESLASCDSEVSADDAFTILDAEIRKDTAEALLLFGKMYDASQTDELIEDRIGLTFTGDDTLAAEYYSRAAASGADTTTLLEETCARLAQSSETLAQSAREDYCK